MELTHTRAHLAPAFLGCFALLMLVGMHYFQHNPGGVGLELPFNLVGWVFVGLMLGLGLWQVTLNGAIFHSRLWLAIVLGAALLLLPLLYPNNAQAVHSGGRLLGLWGGVLWLGCLYQLRFNQRQRHQLLYWVLAAVLIEALFGLVQFFLLKEGNAIGYNVHSNRPYGIFQKPNASATFLLTGVAIGLYLLVQDSAMRRYQRWLLALTTVTATLVMVLNLSRNAYLAGILLLALMLPWAGQKLPRKTLYLWLAGIAAGVLLAVVSFHTSDAEGRGNTWNYISGRTAMSAYSAEMIAEKPLLGWGYGNFERAYLEQQADYVAEGQPFGYIANADHPHNELLLWGVEGGALPLLVFAAMAVVLLRLLWRAPWRRRLAYLGLLTPILSHCMTEFPFYHALVIWLVFLLLLYVIDRDLAEVNALPFAPTFALRCFALLIPAILALFMLTSLHALNKLVAFERGGYRQPALLNEIVNSVAYQDRLEFDVMSLQLRIGLAQNRTDLLEAYVDWAPTLWQHKPRAALYANQILALQALSREQEAQQVLQQARHLYPNDTQFFRDDSPRDKPQLDEDYAVGQLARAGLTPSTAEATAP